MKKSLLILSIGILAVAGGTVLGQSTAFADQGETLFKQNCAACHPEGGNIVNPQKTLHKKDREANGVKTPADIVKKMRNPGPGMTKFDPSTIPDKNAREIAEYIVKKF